MDRELKALYQEASDFFTYVKLYAPDFPPRDEMTCAKAISQLFEYINRIDGSDQNPTAKKWLCVCREGLKKAETLFQDGRYPQARQAVGTSRDYLINAAQRKSIKSSFTIGEPGFVE